MNAPSGNPVLDAALTYASEKGWPVFPCNPLSKKPIGELAPHGFHDATTDPVVIRGWWGERPDAMIGVPTGEKSGLVVLDVDMDVMREIDGEASLVKLLDGEPVPLTLMSRTPRRGKHFLFEYPEDGRRIGNTTNLHGLPGLDVRGEGGYIVVPPSFNISFKRAYEWDDAPILPMPGWMAPKEKEPSPRNAPAWRGEQTEERDRCYAEQALHEECRIVTGAAKGGRNNQLNSSAFSLGQLIGGGCIGEGQVRGALEDAAKVCGLVQDDGWLAVRKTIESGLVAGKEKPRRAPEHDRSRAYGQGNGTEPPPRQEGDPCPQDEADYDHDSDRNRNFGPTGTDGHHAKPRFILQPFDQIIPGARSPCLVQDIIPQKGLVVIWGPPKCGKTFFTLDLVMHIALGWTYRGKHATQGAVLYCSFEGGEGIGRRMTAFRKHHLDGHSGEVPFWLMSGSMSLARDHKILIRDVRQQFGDTLPTCVVLDTLNRSLAGSESSDADMSLYIQAADAICEAFGCVVIVIHHCGINDNRPRGHTSLTGAADAQIAVREQGSINEVSVEYMKDGAAECALQFDLKVVEIGIDEDGQPITSCVVVPVDRSHAHEAPKQSLKLTPAEKVAFDALADGIASFGSVVPSASGVPDGVRGITIDQWREHAYKRGLSHSDKLDARRKAFSRAMTGLTAIHRIGVWDPYVWIAKRMSEP